MLVGSQIWKWEVKERLKLHNLRIEHVVIRSELKYSIVARNVDFRGADFVWKPVARVRFRVRTGPGTDRGIWTHCQQYTRLLFLNFVNSILSKSRFKQPMICYCMLCSVQYWLIWNQCLTFDKLYFCLSGRSIIPLWMRRFAWCLDYLIRNN